MEISAKMDNSSNSTPLPQRQARANNQPNKNIGKHGPQKQIDGATDGGPAEKRQRFGPNNQNGVGGAGGGQNQNKNFGNKGGFGGGGNRNRNRGGNQNRSNFQNLNVSTNALQWILHTFV